MHKHPFPIETPPLGCDSPAIWPVALTVAFTGLALLIHPVGPFGQFWRPSEICPDPTIFQLPFFAVLALTEATSFGLGFAFLAFGYPYVRSVFSKHMAVSVWLAIAWLFINWFPHNALHMNAGIDVWRTIVIDFTFHVTLIVAGCFTAYAFVSRSVSAERLHRPEGAVLASAECV
jgi:hypothetical protein